MIFQETRYKIVTNNDCVTINTYDLDTDNKLIFEIYNKTDINFSNPIVVKELLSNQEAKNCIGIDGHYVILIKITTIYDTCIVVDDDSLGYTYEFSVFNKYTDHYRELSIDIICECDTCDDNKLSDCDFCLETDKLKNDYNSFIFIMFYIFYYSDLKSYDTFINYIQSVIQKYELPITNRFNKMINFGYLRGIFELNNENKFILISAIYIFFYLNDLQNSDYDEAVILQYRIGKIKDCLVNKGLSYEYLEQQVFEYNFKGTVTSKDYNCIGNTDCEEVITELPNLIYEYTKSDFIDGVSLEVQNNEERLIIIIPKVWGLPIEILDNSNTNIKDIFNLVDLDGKYVFISNDIYTKDTYNIKLKYNGKY